jgi:hypothetical protein
LPDGEYSLDVIPIAGYTRCNPIHGIGAEVRNGGLAITINSKSEVPAKRDPPIYSGQVFLFTQG